MEKFYECKICNTTWTSKDDLDEDAKNGYWCPDCHSENIIKEKILGPKKYKGEIL